MMRVRMALLAMAAVLVGSGANAWAQEAAAPDAGGQDTARLTVQSNIVFVPTTVQVKKKGDTIYGLKPEQFEVMADGVPQVVKLDDSDEIKPIALAVVVQCSRGYAMEYQKIRGLATMVDQLIGGAPAQVAVMDFGSTTELLTNFTTNEIRRTRAINSITPCEDDPKAVIYDAVAEANKLFARMDPKGRHVILLVSETRDHGSKSKPADTIRELGRTDTVVDSVAFSPARDEMVADLEGAGGASGGPIGLILAAVQALRKNAAKEFARESGGEYLNFSSQGNFDKGLNSLANRANNYYLLSFQPKFPAGKELPGQLHTISVRVPEYPSALIRHRESYWSDKPVVSGAKP